MKYIKPKKLMNRFPNVIEVSGEPYERGFAIGSKLETLIKKTVDRWFNFLSTIPLKQGLSLSKEDALNLTSKFAPYASIFAPNLFEECRGIADGANIAFNEVFNLNCFLDVMDYYGLPSIRWKPWLGTFGCTDFAVSRKATKNGKNVMIGQNYDLPLPETFQEASIILKTIPDDGPSSLCYTIAGMVGCMGMNSSGISIVINKLFPSDSGPGVPYCFLVRKALEKETINEIFNVITTTKRASGTHFTIANSSGDIFGLEVTATEHEFFTPSNVYGHTNHYISERLKPFDVKGRWISNSYVRLSRIYYHMNEDKGKITLEHCKEWLKDHVDYPWSVCRHGSENEPVESNAKTLTSFIALPRELKVVATNGNPCAQPYEEYEVE